MAKIESEQKLFQSLQLENNQQTDNQLISQTHLITIIKAKLDGHDEEIAALLDSNTDKGEDVEKIKTSLQSLGEQIEAHTALMESLDNLQNYLRKNYKESGLQETLESILKINHENKELIRNIEKKEIDCGEYEDNKDRESRDEIVLNLQRQISQLQEEFDERKPQMSNKQNTKEIRSNSIMELKNNNKVINSERFSNQYFPDMESLVKSVQECGEKLSYLEVNFQDISGISNNKSAELDNKMIKIIEQLNSLMIKMATLEERTRQIDLSCGDLACKLDSLESADVFLQEADRMIIEKVSRMEKDGVKEDIMNCVDDNLLKLTKEVNEQCEEVKDQVRRLQTEIKSKGGNCQSLDKHPGEHKKCDRSNSQLGNVRNITANNNINYNNKHNNNENRNNNNNIENNDENTDRAFTEMGEVVPLVSQDTGKLWSALLELYTAFSKLKYCTYSSDKVVYS